MSSRLEFNHNDHSITVKEDCDWGGPCDYWAHCDCGWTGSTLGDVLHLDGSGKLGTRYDAFVEGLDHLGLTVLDYIKMSEEEVGRYLKGIVSATEEINKLRETVENMRRFA